MKKIFHKMVFFSFLLSACNLGGDTYSMFEHKESMEFYETGKFEDKKLDKYRIDQVLATIGIGKIPDDDNDSYSLSVYFFSHNKENRIILKSVSLSNGKNEIVESPMTEMVFADDSNGLNKSGGRVFSSIESHFLESGSKALQVRVEYELNSKPIVQTYKIDEHKYLIPIH